MRIDTSLDIRKCNHCAIICKNMFSTCLCVLLVFTLVEAYTVDPKCALPLPKSYVAYHLQSGEKIHVDGKLDEPAWERVAWTDPFIGL